MQIRAMRSKRVMPASIKQPGTDVKLFKRSIGRGQLAQIDKETASRDGTDAQRAPRRGRPCYRCDNGAGLEGDVA